MAKTTMNVLAVAALAAVAGAKDQKDVTNASMKFDEMVEQFDKKAFNWRRQYLEDSEWLKMVQEGQEQAVKLELLAQEQADANLKDFKKSVIQAAIKKVELQIKDDKPVQHFINKGKDGVFTNIRKMIAAAYREADYAAPKEAQKAAEKAVEKVWQSWYQDKNGKSENSLLAKDEAYLRKKEEYRNMATDRSDRMKRYQQIFGSAFTTKVNAARAALRTAQLAVDAAHEDWEQKKEKEQEKKTEKAKEAFHEKETFPAQQTYAAKKQVAHEKLAELRKLVKKAVDDIQKPKKLVELQLNAAEPKAPRYQQLKSLKGLTGKAKAKAQAANKLIKDSNATKKSNYNKKLAAHKAYKKSLIVYEACLYYGTCGDEKLREKVEGAVDALSTTDATAPFRVNVANDNEKQAKLENEDRVAEFTKDLLKSLEENEKLMTKEIEKKQKGLFREFQSLVEKEQVEPLRELVKELAGEQTAADVKAIEDAKAKEEADAKKEQEAAANTEASDEEAGWPVWAIVVLIAAVLALLGAGAFILYTCTRTEEVEDDL